MAQPRAPELTAVVGTRGPTARAWRALGALSLVAGCATSAELGVLQRTPPDVRGASVTGHWGIGAVPRRILTGELDVRGDVAAGASRFAVGASLRGGLPVGRYRVLARAGIWHAVASDASARGAVPSFELAGFVPLNDHPRDAAHPEYGESTAGVVVGVREDLDVTAYTTVFVGLALFMVPGY